MRLIDLTGEKYGRLVVLNREKSKNGITMWRCLCECGNKTIVSYQNLKSGHTKSCGCLNRESTRTRSVTHSMSNSRLYHIWKGMKSRCCNPNSGNQNRYYDRGIDICNEWKDNPSAFIKWSLENGYKDTLTIDRIDNDKGYSPQNCRWTDSKTQGRNKRNNLIISFNGKEQPLSAWCEELNLNYDKIWHRIRVAKWDINRALTT